MGAITPEEYEIKRNSC
ncbi:hypothetical protein QNN00_23045 [Bacillus velezensis]|nr:hypothetical protein [Bacillus velezensis]